MPNYTNGKIYKLVSNYTDKVYYGSTIQPLHKRKNSHKGNYQLYLEGKYKYVSSFDLFELGEVNIILVEKFPCESKEELLARERHYIENNECLNKSIPGRTCKEWYKDNPEYNKQYYQANKDTIKQKTNKYYHENKVQIQESRKEYSKQYQEQNKDKIIQRRKEKVICVCGSVVSRYGLNRHKRSEKHNENLELIKE